MDYYGGPSLINPEAKKQQPHKFQSECEIFKRASITEKLKTPAEVAPFT